MKNLRILIVILIGLCFTAPVSAMGLHRPEAGDLSSFRIQQQTSTPVEITQSPATTASPTVDIAGIEEQTNGIITGGVVLILIVAGSTIGLILHDRFNSEEQ